MKIGVSSKVGRDSSTRRLGNGKYELLPSVNSRCFSFSSWRQEVSTARAVHVLLQYRLDLVCLNQKYSKNDKSRRHFYCSSHISKTSFFSFFLSVSFSSSTSSLPPLASPFPFISPLSAGAAVWAWVWGFGCGFSRASKHLSR